MAPPTASVAQAITDTDSDGMDDDWEVQHFGSLAQIASGDFDSDGMTNGEEYAYGFVPTKDDAFEDADGDRYPNVFEVRNSTDPNNAASVPAATFVVNGAGGGTHTTVSAAVSAAGSQSGTYKIIGIAPGVYTGSGNANITATASTKKLLIIGLEGAGKTIIDGGGTSWGWNVYASAVISSLTMRRMTSALYVSTSGEVRFVDLVVRTTQAHRTRVACISRRAGRRTSSAARSSTTAETRRRTRIRSTPAAGRRRS